MEWNEIFKILGPRCKSIRFNGKAYVIVLKKRTIFQFKTFSGEYTTIELYKDSMVLINSEEYKKINKEDWEPMKLYEL